MTESILPIPRLADLILECDLDKPAESVWRALTVPELVAQWLMPNDIRPEAGHRFVLEGRPEEGGKIVCEILAADPPSRLSYSWRLDDGSEHGQETIVTFELSPGPEGGTHLRLVHGGFAIPANRPVDAVAQEPEILVYLPAYAVARRRLRKPRRPAITNRWMPTVMRLAA